MAMDPDRYQMRDLKRRISKLEDQLGYLKTDWKRTTTKLNEISRIWDQVAPILIRLMEQAS